MTHFIVIFALLWGSGTKSDRYAGLFCSFLCPAELGRYKRDQLTEPIYYLAFYRNNLLTPGIDESHEPQLRWKSSNLEGSAGTRRGPLFSPQFYSMLFFFLNVGTWFTDQGLKPLSPWECIVLTTGPSGKSLIVACFERMIRCHLRISKELLMTIRRGISELHWGP